MILYVSLCVCTLVFEIISLYVGADQAHQSSTVSSSSAPASQVTDIVDHVISNVAKLRSV